MGVSGGGRPKRATVRLSDIVSKPVLRRGSIQKRLARIGKENGSEHRVYVACFGFGNRPNRKSDATLVSGSDACLWWFRVHLQYPARVPRFFPIFLL